MVRLKVQRIAQCLKALAAAAEDPGSAPADTYSLHHLTQEEAGAAAETLFVPAGLVIAGAGTCSPGLFRCTLVSLHTVVLRHEKMGLHLWVMLPDFLFSEKA